MQIWKWRSNHWVNSDMEIHQVSATEILYWRDVQDIFTIRMTYCISAVGCRVMGRGLVLHGNDLPQLYIKPSDLHSSADRACMKAASCLHNHLKQSFLFNRHRNTLTLKCEFEMSAVSFMECLPLLGLRRSVQQEERSRRGALFGNHFVVPPNLVFMSLLAWCERPFWVAYGLPIFFFVAENIQTRLALIRQVWEVLRADPVLIPLDQSGGGSVMVGSLYSLWHHPIGCHRLTSRSVRGHSSSRRCNPWETRRTYTPPLLRSCGELFSDKPPPWQQGLEQNRPLSPRGNG